MFAMKIKQDRVSALPGVLSSNPDLTEAEGFGMRIGNLSFTRRLETWTDQHRVIARIMAQLMWGGLLRCCPTLDASLHYRAQGHCSMAAFEALLPPPLKVILSCPWLFVSPALDADCQANDSRLKAKPCSREPGKASLWYYLHFSRNLGQSSPWQSSEPRLYMRFLEVHW